MAFTSNAKASTGSQLRTGASPRKRGAGSSKWPTGNQAQSTGNTHNTSMSGTPSAKACASKKRVMPAVNNPDGKPSRSRGRTFMTIIE